VPGCSLWSCRGTTGTRSRSSNFRYVHAQCAINHWYLCKCSAQCVDLVLTAAAGDSDASDDGRGMLFRHPVKKLRYGFHAIRGKRQQPSVWELHSQRTTTHLPCSCEIVLVVYVAISRFLGSSYICINVRWSQGGAFFVASPSTSYAVLERWNHYSLLLHDQDPGQKMDYYITGIIVIIEQINMMMIIIFLFS